ncbi:MAG TPA: hypothetical protein VH677_03530 [Nitrososphaera sp.]|jgi:hypothetical protein
MKAYAVAVIAALAASLVLVAVQGAAEAQSSDRQLNKFFRLKVGQSVNIPSEDMTVIFEEVTEDSRCPADVECIQAGQATARIILGWAETGIGTASLTTLPGSILSEDSQTVGDYVVVMHSLRPYPTQAGEPIDDEDYVAIVMVAKPRTG